MTKQQTPENGQRWRKVKTHIDPGYDAWEIWEGELVLIVVYVEEDADRIIADHDAAADLAVAREALE